MGVIFKVDSILLSHKIHDILMLGLLYVPYLCRYLFLESRTKFTVHRSTNLLEFYIEEGITQRDAIRLFLCIIIKEY